MAAGAQIPDNNNIERHRRVRRKSILAYVLMVILLPVGFYAWIYWRLLKCQGEYFVNHAWMCRGSGGLPLVPVVALLIPWVLIAFDLIAIAEIKGVPPDRRMRAYQGFRNLDTGWHQLHVAIAGLIVPLALLSVLALFAYLRVSKHLLLW